MTPRGLIDQHVLGRLVHLRRFEMSQIAAEGFLDVKQRDSGRVRDCSVESGGGAAEAGGNRSAGARGIEHRRIERREWAVEILQH